MSKSLRSLALSAALLAPALVGCGPGGSGPPPVSKGPAAGAKPPKTAGPAKPIKPSREAVRKQRELLVDIFNKTPASPAKENGLEASPGWKTAGWEDPCSLKKINNRRTGRSILYLATQGGRKGKSGAALTKDLCLAPKGALRAAVYNRGAATVKVAAAFRVSSAAWVYYESPPQDAVPGKWTQLAFDLGAGNYKTASSKWKYNAGLWKREDVKEVALLVYHGGRPAEVIFDGITIDQAPRPKPKPKPKPGPEKAKPEKKVKEKPAEADPSAKHGKKAVESGPPPKDGPPPIKGGKKSATEAPAGP